MRVFIGIKYYEDGNNVGLIEEIKEIIKTLGHEPYTFRDEEYIKDAKEMMERAFQKLNECDILLLEASEHSFGVGIEAGYAFAKNKKIITIINESKEPSNTLKGTSNHYISYKTISDLKEKLQKVL